MAASGGKNKKYGRNKTSATRYTAEKRLEKSKKKNVAKALALKNMYAERVLKVPRGTARAKRREALQTPF